MPRLARLLLLTSLLGLVSAALARADVIRASSAVAPRTLVQRAPAVPAGATVTGSVAASAPVHLTIALAPSNPEALAAYAAQVADPASGLFRHYLTVGQFAARFGASASELSAVRTALTQAGLSVGSLDPGGLSVTASGTAAETEGAFATQLEHVSLRDGTSAYTEVGNPTLPAAAADAVQGVAGLDTLPAAAPQSLVRAHPALASGRSQPGAAGPSSCIGSHTGAYTAAQIGSAYGLDNAWNAGDLGAGTTVALVELEPFAASDIAAFQRCDGTSATVQAIPIDGGSADCSQSGSAYDYQCGLEDALDIEDVAGLAPKATIHVYEGPNNSVGLLDVYRAIVQSDAPVISTSWGLCEAAAQSGMLTAENTIFQEAAVQGETVLAAAGDSGSDDCGTYGPRAVDDPASQPYVTGVGGTSMPSDAAGAAQTVWNDGYGAGGGGVSRDWALPSFQSAVAQPNAIRCTSVPGGATTSTSCRQVPDVSADADPATGYEIYWTAPPGSSSSSGWIVAGGTSAAAPTWASLVALADSSAACTSAGVRVGFANALLYGLPAADFGDVTSGNNSFDSVPGYSAQSGYDMASGRGTPNGAALLPALCGSQPSGGTSPPPSTTTAVTPTTTPPPATTTVSPPPVSAPPPTTPVTTAPAPTRTTPTSTTPAWTPKPGHTDLVRFLGHRGRRLARVGRGVRFRLRARDRGGLRLRYTSRRLPAGLRINRRTGLITGRPRRTGRTVSRITARDARGDSETIVLRWVVLPRIRHHR